MNIQPYEKIYLKKYEVNVNPYLSYAEIQNIANEAIKYQSWAERNELIDYMLLCYATDIKREDIDEIGHEKILFSGLLDEVKNNINNYYRINEAIEYEESLIKQIALIMDSLPKVVKETVGKVKAE